MILIVGLGNPGLKYKNNRHNVGFLIIDKIKHKLNFPEFKEKFNSKITRNKICQTDVLLLKPLTYMNASGKSIYQCKEFYKIPNENIIIIQDDLDMHFLKVRIRHKGTHGGHNGIKDIITFLGENFLRLKIGINNENVYDPKKFVLENFLTKEMDEFDSLVNKIVKNFADLLSKRFTTFLNKIRK